MTHTVKKKDMIAHDMILFLFRPAAISDAMANARGPWPKLNATITVRAVSTRTLRNPGFGRHLTDVRDNNDSNGSAVWQWLHCADSTDDDESAPHHDGRYQQIRPPGHLEPNRRLRDKGEQCQHGKWQERQQ